MSMGKLCAAVVILLAMLPAARLAWTWRAMPHLGFYHDDSLYWVSAKSLASGAGYRIASLPDQPYQTKYPPLYPALLAAVWKIDPRFPANLPLAALLAFAVFPIYIALALAFARQCGFTRAESVALTVAAALNPVAALFSVSLMPELLFTALLLASLIAAERAAGPDASPRLAAWAGALAALAYLTRSAALPLLVTAPLCFLIRKRPRAAAAFFASMFPAVALWQLWVRAHLTHANDLVTLYYTDYFGFRNYNLAWRDLPLVFWHNLDAYLMSIGKLLTFDFELGSPHLERVAAVAAIAGCVRLAARTRKLHFPAAAAAYSALLLIWHYPPDQRFVFPLYPLLLAGIWTELTNVVRALRRAWAKPALLDRSAAALAGAALAAFALFVAGASLSGVFRFLPAVLAAHSADLDLRLPAYRWLAANAPRGANVYAYDDPLLFLYTGRASCGLPIPPKLLYRGDSAGLDRLLDDIPEFVRANRLDYVLLTQADFYRDLQTRGAERVRRAVESSGAFRRVYGAPALAVYRFAPAAIPAAHGR